MSSTIPKLTLFPLYPGGPRVQNAGGLNANSSFYLRPTKFTPAYGVNIPPETNPYDTDTYYTLRGDQTVVKQFVSQARSYNTNLGFDGTVQGNLKQVTAPTVAPQIPDLYQEAAELLSISDLNFTDLMALPEFRIPGVGMGLKVTTDGLGHVDTIAISPSSRGQLPGVSAISMDFGRPNRAEVTAGATFKTLDPGFNLGGSISNNTAGPVRADNAVDGQNQLPQFNNNTLGRNAGIFNLDKLEQLALGALRDPQDSQLDQLGPVLERLYQLQAGENGLAVSGYDASIDAEQARQLAASQAKLNVSPSDDFKQNVAAFVSAASRSSESYAAAYTPKMDQLMNGRVNVTPWQSASASGNGNMSFGSGNAFEMGGAVADAMSRKGRGSYIPFQMSGGQSQGQAFAGTNPFMGGGTQSGNMGYGGQSPQSGQQFRMPRKPLAFMA